MGYNTSYTLTCSDDALLEKLIDEDDNDEVLGFMSLSRTGGKLTARVSDTKWYEHEADMRNMSSKHKGVLFTLCGEGEEGGDLWRKYFLNGKMQESYARIEYDSFDSEKLK